MVYDQADGYVLLFGGDNSSLQDQPLNDTWVFSAGNWTKLSPTVAPSAREFAAIAYDAVDGYVLLFGGFTSTYDGLGTDIVHPLNDTWKFSHGTWTRLFTALAPPDCVWAGEPYFAGTAAYDTHLAAVILDPTCGYQWKYVGGGWSNMTTAGSPASGPGSSAYDAANGSLIALGSKVASSSALPPGYSSTTSFFANSTWSSPKSAPSALYGRVLGSIEYDRNRQGPLLFGGITADYLGYAVASPVYGDTWVYGGGNWHELAAPKTPPARFFGQMVFDGKDHQTVLFGGVGAGNILFSRFGPADILSDTWEIS